MEYSRNQRPREYKFVAHHIVPENAKHYLAEKSREILAKFRLDVNGAVNGVYLPSEPGKSLAALHRGRHTGEYIKEVHKMIKDAKSREQLCYYLETTERWDSEST